MEFWNDEFLPSILKFKHALETDTLRQLIDSLEFAKKAIP